VAQALRNLHAVESNVHQRDIGARGPEAETKVVLDGELVIEKARMAKQANFAPDVDAIFSQVMSEHEGLSRADRDQARARTQQARYACPIWPAKMYNFALAHVEGDTGEEGEPPT
jgi:hypothetical protein